MAQSKVDTAWAMAQTRFAEDQRTELSQQREKARLDARTREADAAKRQAAAAIADSARQKEAADAAATMANAAIADSARQKEAADAAATMAAATSAEVARNAANQNADMQREIASLQARVTDRGLVLTLGDVLFASGQATLQAGAGGNLDKLVAFLNKYPQRAVAIEGHTDSMGGDDANQMLSQRRADAVKAYLVGRGIDSARLTASGRGETAPVAPNESAAGRQQNRRVELVIDNPPTAAIN
jgi:outer membrane protein OmpA-like peptidoglycan-associated protein